MINYLDPSNKMVLALFSISIILLAGFLFTRLTKLARLPNNTGYIIAGVIAVPHVLKIIPAELVENMSFISDRNYVPKRRASI